MYVNDVKRYIRTHLDVQMLFFDLGVHFRSLVEECFLLKSDLKKPEKAIAILHVLFSELVPGMDFAGFVKKHQTKKPFLSCLLYHIFSLSFPLMHMRSKDELESYLFRIQAQVSNRIAWKTLSYSQKIKFLAFACAFYDEGSFALLQYVKKQFKQVETGLIEPKAFWKWANSFKTISEEDFANFLAAQEQDKQRRIQKISQFTNADATHFVNTFGLFGHQIPFGDTTFTDEMGLDEKPAFKAYYERHIHATQEQYEEGVKRIAYCIPTCGRDLAKMPIVQSLLDGFKKAKLSGSIYIFDQSDEKQYQKNSAYIKKTKGNIVHLSKEQLIALAKKHGYYDLIVTGAKGRFGYAGARNAIFLLAPILHRSKDTLIMMCDDDLFIPASNILSDALFSHLHKGQYYSRFGCIVGRTTTEVYVSIDPKVCLTEANRILSQCRWSSVTTPHYMSSMLTCPKLCLNIPLGQEENHFLALQSFDFDFRKPALHLAGFRYPKNVFPTNRYSGLTDHLYGLNSYVLGLMLVEELLDPCNISNRCALVWNLEQKPCTSFEEALQLILKPSTVKAMQEQFWKNFSTLLDGFSNKQSRAISKTVQTLIDLDVEKLMQEHAVLHPYMLSFKKEVKELKHFFAKMGLEAKWFKEFALAIKGQDLQAIERAKETVEKISAKPIEEHYFTYSLYTLCKSVGAADFQRKLVLCQC